MIQLLPINLHFSTCNPFFHENRIILNLNILLLQNNQLMQAGVSIDHIYFILFYCMCQHSYCYHLHTTYHAGIRFTF
jgi:hypothetical protein